MVTLNVDLGQILIIGSIGVIGWFLKKEITSFNTRLDKHEEAIFSMTGTLQKLIGEMGMLVKFGDGGYFHKRSTDTAEPQ